MIGLEARRESASPHVIALKNFAAPAAWKHSGETTVSARLSFRSPIPLFQSSIAEKIRVDTFLAQERR
jgi:hypothetical protein